MTEAKGPEYIFPQDNFTGVLEDKFQRQGGLELRDYFAAKALAGQLANSMLDDITTDTMAKWSYEYADAMLEARKPRALEESGV